jgi:hypothetical protein
MRTSGPSLVTLCAFVFCASCRVPTDADVRFVGTWRWFDRSTELVAQRDLTLTADGKFSLATTYPPRAAGFEDMGWWRLKGDALAFNFWNEDHPPKPDVTLRVVNVQKEALVVRRGSESLTMKRIK